MELRRRLVVATARRDGRLLGLVGPAPPGPADGLVDVMFLVALVLLYYRPGFGAGTAGQRME
ncbi:MAG: hypothetical protein V5A39_05515 [Haloarculaceae archaeon]